MYSEQIYALTNKINDILCLKLCADGALFATGSVSWIIRRLCTAFCNFCVMLVNITLYGVIKVIFYILLPYY